MRTLTRLLSLILGLSIAVVASGAGAAQIVLIANFTCTDVLGVGTQCDQNPGIPFETDLTDGGSNYAFELDVNAIQGIWEARILAADGVSSDLVVVSGVVAPGPILVDFASFTSVDFTSLASVLLSLSSSSAPGDFITVGLTAQVPEPSTAALLTLGLVGLHAFNRRHRSAGRRRCSEATSERTTPFLLTLPLLFVVATASLEAEAAVLIIDDFTLEFATSGANSDAGGYLHSRTARVSSGIGEIRVLGGELIVTDELGSGISADLVWPSFAAAPQVDLIDGTNDRFELIVSGVTGGSWAAKISIDDGINASTVASAALVAPGSYVFLFNDFVPMDFASIDQLMLTLESVGFPGDSLHVGQIRAVPEPGSSALVSVGVLGFACLSRCRGTR